MKTKRVVGVNIPEDLIQEIRTIAGIEHRSLSAEIVYLVEKGLERTKEKNLVLQGKTQIDMEAFR